MELKEKKEKIERERTYCVCVCESISKQNDLFLYLSHVENRMMKFK